MAPVPERDKSLPNGFTLEGESARFVALRPFGPVVWQGTLRHARQIVPNVCPGRGKRDKVLPNSTRQAAASRDFVAFQAQNDSFPPQRRRARSTNDPPAEPKPSTTAGASERPAGTETGAETGGEDKPVARLRLRRGPTVASPTWRELCPGVQRGPLPCLRPTRRSRLVPSNVKQRAMVRRVSAGSITKST